MQFIMWQVAITLLLFSPAKNVHSNARDRNMFAGKNVSNVFVVLREFRIRSLNYMTKL